MRAGKKPILCQGHMPKIRGTPDQVLVELRRRLDLVWQDLTFAIACFEAFRIAARDARLLGRLGKSYATGAFKPIRDALFRETVLALMRIWDNSARNNLRMDDIVDNLIRPEVASLIKQRRRSAVGGVGANADSAEAAVRRDIRRVEAIRRRIRAGNLKESVDALKRHRHEFLAHTAVVGSSASQIRQIKYGDERYLLRWSAKLSQLLNILVDDLHVSPRQDTKMFRMAAKSFWEPVRAETISERRAVLDSERGRRIR
jgi:hypothetical protein